jgi:hypothetical protein
MLNKVSSLARALGIILAVVAGLVTLGMLNTTLVLVVLGLISGITMPSDRMIGVGIYVLVLPAVGAALGHIPMIDEQIGAVTTNLALVAAAALGSAFAIYLFNVVKGDLMGLSAKA